MAYLFGLFIIALFFGVMHFYTELSSKQKLTSTILAFALVMGAILFNAQQSAQAEHVRAVMLSYKQGKSLNCNDLNVSQKNFTLSIGTQTFIGRPEGEHAGKMISARACE